MTPEQFQKYIASLQIKVKNAINSDLPKIIGNEAVRLFKQNFQKESFFNKPWQEVLRRQTHTVTYKTKGGKTKTRIVKMGKGAAGSRKILTGNTGNLGRSIQYKTEPGKAIVFSDLPYSAAHNDGTENAGRGRHTKIPKRQFIGQHNTLDKAIKNKIEQHLNNLQKQ